MDKRFRQNIAPDFAALSSFVASLPEIFERGEGEIIYDGRNQLRRFVVDGHRLIVKSFRVPNLVNRIAYGWLRASKAQRSFEYAAMLRETGIGSPAPVAWLTERVPLALPFCGSLLTRSYYVCLESTLPYSYKDVLAGTLAPDVERRALEAIARTTARLHNHGWLHKDYSRGNILFGPAAPSSAAGADNSSSESIDVEIIDLNRIRFGAVSLEAGLANLFERLPASPEQHKIMESAYREARNSRSF